VVLAFSLDGHLYPIGALIMAATILDHWGLLNTLNGIPIAHTHMFSQSVKNLEEKKIKIFKQGYLKIMMSICHWSTYFAIAIACTSG